MAPEIPPRATEAPASHTPRCTPHYKLLHCDWLGKLPIGTNTLLAQFGMDYRTHNWI